MASCHFFLFCLFVLFALGNAGGDLGRGFGDKYDWHTLEEGLVSVSLIPYIHSFSIFIAFPSLHKSPFILLE